MIEQAIAKAAPKQLSGEWNPRKRALTVIAISIFFLAAMVLSGVFLVPDQVGINLQVKISAPSWAHPFGTDWLGRDMLVRTVKGLSLSFGIGLLAAFVSVIIALTLSLLAAMNEMMDSAVTWLIDLFLGVPHLVIMILISFSLGGGFQGIVVAVALTHWPSLTRLLRAEVFQVMDTNYVAVSGKMGKSRFWVATRHIIPHLIPQLIVGFILLFPHAILHEAAITFLGFGLSPEQPAIGVILSESMRYLSTGAWWLAIFPGLALLTMVGIFDALGRNVRKLVDPFDGKKL